jgi:hypothetical protein
MLAGLSRRNQILGVLLAATLAVSAWTLLSPPDDAVVAPAARGNRPAGTADARHAAAHAAAKGTLGLALGQRPAPPEALSNLFGSYSYQAPTVSASAPAAARPHAPALPFTYTGHLEIDGKDTYLFLQGDVPITASVGTVIGEFTLVEARNQTLIFLHGPTGERVSLSIAAVNG